MDAHEFRERLRSIAREKVRAPDARRRAKEPSALLCEVWPTGRTAGLTVAEPPWPGEVREPKAGALPAERVLVVDIEAMGFRDLPVFLVGLAEIAAGGVKIEQYIAEHPEEEKVLLEAVTDRLQEGNLSVTYNGGSYDFPLLAARCTCCRVSWPEHVRHLDLLHIVRRRLGGELADCRLATVEAALAGVDRRRDVGSQSIPELYKRYVADGNGRVLVPVLEHNLIDTAATALIYLELARRFPDEFEALVELGVDGQGELFAE
jgi:uncharacterized protein YprB with RNaseH-like and TPR domain